MSWREVRVKASIILLPTERGGRSSPLISGYRPNHNFLGPDKDKMCMGQVTVDNDESIQPGQEKSVEILFVLLDEYVELLEPGFKWRIQEGSRHVGDGEIIEVYDSP